MSFWPSVPALLLLLLEGEWLTGRAVEGVLGRVTVAEARSWVDGRGRVGWEGWLEEEERLRVLRRWSKSSPADEQNVM